MPEQLNGNDENKFSNAEMSWKIGPREFIFKYLKFIPWIILCSVIAYRFGLAQDQVHHQNIPCSGFHAHQK